jgi:hypothetical protein
MATITQRINELLAAHSVDEAWMRRAVELGTMTTSRVIFEQHPLLKKLRELDEGWLDKSRGVRLHSLYPALAGIDFANTLQLELCEEDVLDQSGPVSDFDPLNSVHFAGVPGEDLWYSLLCLPTEPVTRWPVIQCDPTGGNDSEITVAISLEHFLHQWMCRDGPYVLSPLTDTPDTIATDIVNVMGAVFRINIKEATTALHHSRHPDYKFHRTPTPPHLQPYIDEITLRQLDRLMIKPT